MLTQRIASYEIWSAIYRIFIFLGVEKMAVTACILQATERLDGLLYVAMHNENQEGVFEFSV